MLPKCVNFQIVLENHEADRCHSKLYIPTVRILKIHNDKISNYFTIIENIILFFRKF